MKAIAVLLLLHSAALAAPCTEAQKVTTPCEGFLLPRSDFAKAVRCVGEQLPACELERKKVADECAVVAERLVAERDAERLRGNLLDKRLAEVAAIAPPTRPWYSSPTLWAMVGLGAGIGATVAIYEGLVR